METNVLVSVDSGELDLVLVQVLADLKDLSSVSSSRVMTFDEFWAAHEAGRFDWVGLHGTVDLSEHAK